MTDEIPSIEDAITHIQQTAFNPEIAGPLIRNNLKKGMCSEYRFLFYLDADRVPCATAQVVPCFKPKYLGKFDGLE